MTVKVFINDRNMAMFACPACETTKTVDVSEYKDIDKAVKVKCKCKCGNAYTAILERRKFFRKETNLSGVCIAGRDDRCLMSVKDILRSGLGLKLNHKPDFKANDKKIVKFYLDDEPRSLIKKEVIVRIIRGFDVGVEFLSFEHYDRLGLYLL